MISTTGTILYVSVPDANRKYLGAQMMLSDRAQPVSMDINPWEHLNYFDLAHVEEIANQPRKILAATQRALHQLVLIRL